jgi:hypothetical protein
MKKFKVYGNVNVVVTKEVWANTPEEAMEKAQERLCCLTAYCGNGGYDKLVGVANSDESVDVFDDIVYDDVEEIEDDPDYFECPSCEEECEACESDNGFKYWYCAECDTYYDEDGDEFYPDVEEEDE